MKHQPGNTLECNHARCVHVEKEATDYELHVCLTHRLGIKTINPKIAMQILHLWDVYHY